MCVPVYVVGQSHLWLLSGLLRPLFQLFLPIKSQINRNKVDPFMYI